MFTLRNRNTEGGTEGKNQDYIDENLIKGYVEVPNDQWLEIPNDAFIKYQKKTGEMVRGGYVIGRSIENNTLYLISDRSNMSSPRWTITMSAIKRLWKKQIDTNSNITSLAKSIKILNDRVMHLESESSLKFGDIEPKADNEILVGRIAKLEYRCENIEDDIRKLLKVIKQIAEVDDD